MRHQKFPLEHYRLPIHGVLLNDTLTILNELDLIRGRYSLHPTDCLSFNREQR